MKPSDPVDEAKLRALPPLVTARLAARDADGLLALASHDSEVVRETVAEQLLREAEAGRDLEPALPALERLLGDRDFGGVIFHATRAVLAAVARGLDVSRLVGVLSRYADEIFYPDEGWASGPDLYGDRRSYYWGLDVNDILQRHARNLSLRR